MNNHALTRPEELAARARRLFPPSGPAYELFDASVLLLTLGGIGYVLTNPPPNTAVTLIVLRVIPEEVLGWVLAAAALVGIATSYSTRWLRIGYIATISASLAMSGFFAIGWLFVDGSGIRALLSAVLYGWIGRRLIRDAG